MMMTLSGAGEVYFNAVNAFENCGINLALSIMLGLQNILRYLFIIIVDTSIIHCLAIPQYCTIQIERFCFWQWT